MTCSPGLRVLGFFMPAVGSPGPGWTLPILPLISQSSIAPGLVLHVIL